MSPTYLGSFTFNAHEPQAALGKILLAAVRPRQSLHLYFTTA